MILIEFIMARIGIFETGHFHPIVLSHFCQSVFLSFDAVRSKMKVHTGRSYQKRQY